MYAYGACKWVCLFYINCFIKIKQQISSCFYVEIYVIICIFYRFQFICVDYNTKFMIIFRLSTLLYIIKIFVKFLSTFNGYLALIPNSLFIFCEMYIERSYVLVKHITYPCAKLHLNPFNGSQMMSQQTPTNFFMITKSNKTICYPHFLHFELRSCSLILSLTKESLATLNAF